MFLHLLNYNKVVFLSNHVFITPLVKCLSYKLSYFSVMCVKAFEVIYGVRLNVSSCLVEPFRGESSPILFACKFSNSCLYM